MAFAIFNALQGKILPPITDLIGKSSELVGWVTPLIAIGITIAMMIYGYDVVRGSGGNQYFLDALAKVARPVMVLHLALLGGMYSSTVVAFATDLRTDLSGLFGAKGANSYAAIDAAVDSVMQSMIEAIPRANEQISIMPANLQGVVIYLCMTIVMLGMLVYAVVACLNLLIVDASLALVFGLGPIFVAAFAFQITAKFFDSWLSAVLKYTLTAVFIAVVIGLSNVMIQRFATAVMGATTAVSFFMIAATSFATAGILVALIVRASSLAGDLVGGMGLNLVGPAAAMKAAAPIAGAAARAGSYAGGAAAGAAGRAAVSTGMAAAGTPLGVSVLKATESMRGSMASVAGKAGTGAKNFGNAVAGRGTDASGRTTYGQGVGNAFNVGHQATSPSAGAGTGTVNGGRPVPSAK